MPKKKTAKQKGSGKKSSNFKPKAVISSPKKSKNVCEFC